jgi:hypothetical protein
MTDDDDIPPDIALVIAESERIHGPDNKEKSEFWLLPFATPAETLEFLRTVPSGSGGTGIREALDRRFGTALPELPTNDDAPGA